MSRQELLALAKITGAQAESIRLEDNYHALRTGIAGGDRTGRRRGRSPCTSLPRSAAVSRLLAELRGVRKLIKDQPETALAVLDRLQADAARVGAMPVEARMSDRG